VRVKVKEKIYVRSFLLFTFHTFFTIYNQYAQLAAFVIG